jgi:hypothetical protein
LGEDLLVVGKARSTRYAARRVIDGVGNRTPIYEISSNGKGTRIAVLHSLLPDRFYVEPLSPDLDSGFYEDLPYFLFELRPSGFLGRMVPRQHPDLDLPGDVRLWSAAHTLLYLTRFGYNLTGNLILGDLAFSRYVSAAQDPPGAVPANQRRRRYPQMAADVFRTAAIGSSTGGEQPKFLTARLPGPTPVIVKFTPPDTDWLSRRRSDLLVAEHVAHEVLTAHGRTAARSELVIVGPQTFLEVARFDRTPEGGRVGLLSLLALDVHFVGRARSWTDSTSRLADQGVVAPDTVQKVRWLELFGGLIANNDMHAANLSFFVRGSRVVGLAPAYDMLPALYAGQQGPRHAVSFEPPPLTAADAPVWDTASRAAIDFWRRVAAHDHVSEDFRAIAHDNAARIETWRKAGRLLPTT